MELVISANVSLVLILLFVVIFGVLTLSKIHDNVKNKRQFNELRLTGKYYYRKTTNGFILLVQKIKDDDSLVYFKAEPEEIKLLQTLNYIK
tara:strand:+ start:99202 stop:99474 length:273 start_codon:yes stop_codon:yes gene_type:complete